MTDLFEFEACAPTRPVWDIHNLRPSSAEEKAILALRLGRLINKVPACIINGSVQQTRDWIHHRDMARKALSAKRLSVNSLQDFLKQMESYK